MDSANPFNLTLGNFRPLGMTSPAIRPGAIFRSADLSFATSRDADVITRALGCKTYLDL